MARRTLVWHLGLADAPRAVVGTNLAAHRAALAERGARVAATPEEARLATHEVLRTHRAASLSREDVEGRWSRICERVWQHKGVSLLSTPQLCVADKDQLRFALDQLVDVEVHLVLTLDTIPAQLYGGWLAELRAGATTGWEKYVRRVLADPPEHRQALTYRDGHALDEVVGRWGWTLRPERLHVLALPGVVDQWAAFLDVAGIADGPPAVVPPYADPAGVAVLRKVNRQLDGPLRGADEHLLARAEEPAALPAVATPELEPALARWATDLAAADHDLRGDLAGLLGDADGVALPGPRDQLGTAVDALADALAENARLRAEVDALVADNARLDRKRRSLKRRLRAAAAE